MATARSAIAAKVSGRLSEAETQAWRLPISTRRPRSTDSERSTSSSLRDCSPIDTEAPRVTRASALSAPAARAAASRASARSDRVSDMDRSPSSARAPHSSGFDRQSGVASPVPSPARCGTGAIFAGKGLKNRHLAAAVPCYFRSGRQGAVHGRQERRRRSGPARRRDCGGCGAVGRHEDAADRAGGPDGLAAGRPGLAAGIAHAGQHRARRADHAGGDLRLRHVPRRAEPGCDGRAGAAEIPLRGDPQRAEQHCGGRGEGRAAGFHPALRHSRGPARRRGAAPDRGRCAAGRCLGAAAAEFRHRGGHSGARALAGSGPWARWCSARARWRRRGC